MLQSESVQEQDRIPSMDSSVESQDAFSQNDRPSKKEDMKYYTGVGRYYWDGGHIYEGQFKNGKLDGFGELVWAVELGLTEKYEGIFKDGVMSQVGSVTWADGTQYSGYWSNGKFDKVGVLRLKDSIKQKQSNGSDVFAHLRRPKG